MQTWHSSGKPSIATSSGIGVTLRLGYHQRRAQPVFSRLKVGAEKGLHEPAAFVSRSLDKLPQIKNARTSHTSQERHALRHIRI